MFDQSKPLAERIRPFCLADLVGQEHLTKEEGGVLSLAVQSGQVPSMILWGSPGTGKTTIANIIAHEIKKPFYPLSAINAGVKDIREIIQKATLTGRSIVFIDEIHRFNKGQQDALLGAIEKGIITLIGATTENPSFEVNAALLSRTQVYRLKDLGKDDLQKILEKAIHQDEYLKKQGIKVQETEALFNLSGGDARKLLNLLELVVQNDPEKTISNRKVIHFSQQKTVLYDKKGEMHYDIISAFIKSIRGSDPNAAVYYLARMIAGGEDVKFIARRLLILASEDIGNANPSALILATNTFHAVNMIGYPEAEIILSQCTTYLASSPKSNASYKAIKKAKQVVNETGDLPIPLAIRNAPTQLMKDNDYGKGYKYAHDYPNSFVEIDFLPEKIQGHTYYYPGDNVRENAIKKFLKIRWKNKYDY